MSRFFNELRIVVENGESPRDLFLDPLTGTVTTGKQFEVAQSVVGRWLHLVMDGLFGPQFSSKVLLHNVSVLKHFTSFDAIDAWEAKPDISLFRDVASYLASLGGAYPLISRKEIPSLKRASAWVAACFSSIKAVSLRCEDRSADSAWFGFDSRSTNVRTSTRAVQRVFAEFLMVLTQLSRASVKGLAAIFASELDGGDAVALTPVDSLVGFVAGKRAKLTTGVLRLGAERSRTLLTGQLDRQWSVLSLFGAQTPYSECLSVSSVGAL